MEIKKLIPKGVYCYEMVGYDEINDIMKCKYCPFYVYLDIMDVTIPYCLCEKRGAIDNISDNEYEILKKHFNCSEDELDEMFNGDLLWDGCKICGVNNDEDLDL